MPTQVTPDDVLTLNEACDDYVYNNARKVYCGLKEITAQHYDDMYNVLPPIDTWNGFFMSSFMIGDWTTQYCEYGGRYFKRIVNYRDESTWITSDQCYALTNPQGN